MAAGLRYIASASTEQKTLRPAVLRLGDIAICVDRAENTVPLLRMQSLH
jgi:hypothetical protein